MCHTVLDFNKSPTSIRTSVVGYRPDSLILTYAFLYGIAVWVELLMDRKVMNFNLKLSIEFCYTILLKRNNRKAVFVSAGKN